MGTRGPIKAGVAKHLPGLPLCGVRTVVPWHPLIGFVDGKTPNMCLLFLLFEQACI